MDKKVINTSDLKGAKVIANKEYTVIFRLNDGSILKVFNPNFLFEQKDAGIDIEAKILDADPLKYSPEIIVPNYAAYDSCGRFLGYNCDSASGVDFKTYYDNLSFEQHCDLTLFADIHSRM